MLVCLSACLPPSLVEGETGLSGDMLSLPDEDSDPPLCFLTGRWGRAGNSLPPLKV